ncbi:PPE1 phosphatase, partial [Polypterus senegalus]
MCLDCTNLKLQKDGYIRKTSGGFPNDGKCRYCVYDLSNLILITNHVRDTVSTALKAAILIQQWFRRYMARLEIRRRYTWSIFQSIEYAGEQDQLQLSSFFTFMLDNFTHLSGDSPDLISHVLDPNNEEAKLAKYEKIEVPDSYAGPRLSFPLTVVHTNALLSGFKQQQNGLPSDENPYLFNGDFVDRGKKSMEIIIILFAFLLVYPNNMHLNRGNHEDYIMNLSLLHIKTVYYEQLSNSQLHGGVLVEILSQPITHATHGREILQLLQDVFSFLPIATIIDNKVLIVHGGISDFTDLDVLASIERHKFKSALRLPKLNTDDSPDKGKKRVQFFSQCIGVGGLNKNQTTFQSNGFLPSSDHCSSFHTKQCKPCYSKEKDVMTTGDEHHPPSQRLFNPSAILEVPFLDSGINFVAEQPIREELEWKQLARASKETPTSQIALRTATATTTTPTLLSHERGRISTSDWATAVESVLHLDLPWRTLRSHLVKLGPDGNVDYLSCFEDLQIERSIKEGRLEKQTTRDAKEKLGYLPGLISIEEFRQTWKLFSSHLHIPIDDEAIDDLARSIDYNKDGSIDFNEFLEAFRVVHKLDSKEN